MYSDENQWCDFPENVDCGMRPVCDEHDENCHMVTTPEPTFCELVRVTARKTRGTCR